MGFADSFISGFTQIYNLAKQPVFLVNTTQVVDGMGHTEDETEGTQTLIYAVIQPVSAKMLKEHDDGWIQLSDYVMDVPKGTYNINIRDLIQFPLSSTNTEDSTTEEYEVMDMPDDWGLAGQNVYQGFILRRRQIDRS